MKKILLAIGIVWGWQSYPLSIMLAPTEGDSQSYQLATALKTVLEQMGPVRVVLSHVLHETTTPLQTANFANRLRVDLFVSLALFSEREARTSVHLYYMRQHPVTDQWTRRDQLAFYPFDQAHLEQLPRSMGYADALKRNLQSARVELKGPFGLPYKSLTGLSVPAVALEIGGKYPDDWQKIVHPLAQALAGLFV